MTGFQIEVPFVSGKRRPRLTTRPHPHAVTDARDREDMDAIRDAFMRYVNAPGCFGQGPSELPLYGPHVPVRVSIDVFRKLPASRPKSVTKEPDTYKPDTDNVGKLVLDALNGLAWADDAQVTKLNVQKHDRSRLMDHDLMCIYVEGVEP